MQFTNTFTVPLEPDEALEYLADLERVAPCMPGAKLTEVEDEVHHGQVKVKLGPMSLTYRGTARVTEIDAQAQTARIEATGQESRGGGSANAIVSATLKSVDGGTMVEVTTQLDVAGKAAQFGRGALEDVGSRIIDSFADCMSQTLGAAAETVSTTDKGDATPLHSSMSHPRSPRQTQDPALDLTDVLAGPTIDQIKIGAAIGLGALLLIWIVRRTR